MSGFSTRQLKKLATSFDTSRVRSREQNGKTLFFIEGWFAISEANRIFGYDGWDREMVHFERSYSNVVGGQVHCGYLARVRVRVRAGKTDIVREGSGFGSGVSANQSEAHDIALKGAETDATKRALATFGDRFGLLLYDKDRLMRLTVPPSPDRKTVTEKRRQELDASLPKQKVKLIGVEGGEHSLSPESFFSAMRQMVERCENVDQLKQLESDNRPTMELLRQTLKTKQGRSYSAILDDLIVQKYKGFVATVAVDVEQPNGAKEAAAPKASSELSAAPAAENRIFETVQQTALVAIDAKMREGSKEPVPPYPLAEAISRVKMPVNPRILAIPPRPSDYDPDKSKIVPIAQIGLASSADKSVLHLATDRKIRNKAHLAFVSSKPCLICEQLPCHAHHIRFAQRRGMSQKVSDEFTVPLCAIHHNSLHQSASEIAWWHEHGLEPLKLARELWEHTMKGVSAL